ncbi:hypothetical protein Taro_052393 [Colocasia esculenta]|uniref:Uncharacterized protein n=1 Tax=Colocasia esculenta TaxID=4460 RepID=A0A843XIG6_COLES|nr:hypothetical protein [Colocasia esculenta]
MGQECLDRLSITLGGNPIVPVASELLPAFLAAPEWQKHHAALITLAQIAEGCSEVMDVLMTLQGSQLETNDPTISYMLQAKFQDQKITQPHSLDGSIATIDDTYAQVFGKDRPGRIRGVGIGLTPKSLWGGVSTQVQQQEEQIHLTQFMKDMADKISKIESIVLQDKCDM